MFKEICICLLIILMIFVGNHLTYKYTKEVSDNIVKDLLTLREALIDNENKSDNDIFKKDIDEIYKRWSNAQFKLAFFIEHTELDKVEIELAGLKGNIDTKQIDDCIAYLDRCIFVLQHIKDKYTVKIQNIF